MNFVKALFHNNVLLGLLVAAGAQAAAHYGIVLDAQGITNDIVSLIGVIVTAQGHVKTVRSDAIPPSP